MPQVAVCYKWVVDEADIRVEGNGTLSLERAGRKISEYDRNAIEAGVQVVEQHGGSLTAFSLGAPEVKNSAKDVLSRGADQAVLALDAKFEHADPHTVALGLAKAISSNGPFDVILCGEGSGDLYGQQVGPRVAELLGIPAVTFVNKFTIDPAGVVAERKLEDGVEVVEATFPVLLTVLPDLNKPRIPGLKQVMGAAKKPVKVLDAAALELTEAELAPRLGQAPVKAPASSRKQVKVDSPAALAEAIVAALR